MVDDVDESIGFYTEQPRVRRADQRVARVRGRQARQPAPAARRTRELRRPTDARRRPTGTGGLEPHPLHRRRHRRRSRPSARRGRHVPQRHRRRARAGSRSCSRTRRATSSSCSSRPRADPNTGPHHDGSAVERRSRHARPLVTVAAPVGTHRLHRLRRSTHAHRAAARAVRRPGADGCRRASSRTGSRRATCCPARPRRNSRSSARGGSRARAAHWSAASHSSFPDSSPSWRSPACSSRRRHRPGCSGAAAGAGGRGRRGRRQRRRRAGPCELAAFLGAALAMDRVCRGRAAQPRRRSAPGSWSCSSVAASSRSGWRPLGRRSASRAAPRRRSLLAAAVVPRPAVSSRSPGWRSRSVHCRTAAGS